MVNVGAEQTVAQRMKDYRLHRRWTLQRMAKRVGLSTTGVWQIENGKTDPHEITIAKIKRAIPDLFEEQQTAAR